MLLGLFFWLPFWISLPLPAIVEIPSPALSSPVSCPVLLLPPVLPGSRPPVPLHNLKTWWLSVLHYPPEYQQPDPPVSTIILLDPVPNLSHGNGLGHYFKLVLQVVQTIKNCFYDCNGEIICQWWNMYHNGPQTELWILKIRILGKMG